MRTVNTVTLLGNIARIPLVRTTTNGKKFSTFVLATHREWVEGEERKSTPEFHNIVAWGNLAEIAENFCSKGRLVYVEGYLKTRSWEHENGAKIFRTEVVATNIIALNKPMGHEEEGEMSDMPVVDEDDFFASSDTDFEEMKI
ncbi:MAG: single-stranded DNA-binding protein [Candidatus Peregrinibacteria bacterium]